MPAQRNLTAREQGQEIRRKAILAALVDTCPPRRVPLASIENNDGVHAAGAHIAARPNAEQQRVLDAVKQGLNVFWTGSAGTGKSFLLELAVQALSDMYKDRYVAVTASTGMAASSIHGTTLHSWASIVPGERAQAVIKKLKSHKSADTARYCRGRIRWKSSRALVVDEISLVDAELLDDLDLIARAMRRDAKNFPFGGLQILMCGDFFQLPPVTKAGEPRRRYAFESEAWAACNLQVFNLEQVFRQADAGFVALLQQVRLGRVSPEAEEALLRLDRPLRHLPAEMVPTHLFPRRGEAEARNEAILSKRCKETRIYRSKDCRRNVDLTPELVRKVLDDELVVSAELLLGVGAQVILLKNASSDGLVNGTLGTVVALEYDSVLVDWETEAGSLRRQVAAVKFEVLTATRTQLPIALGWAMSIHKAQGQTLAAVTADLDKVFTHGQAYVAMSRTARIEDLRVINFSRHRVTVDERVVAWYDHMMKGAH